MIGTEYSWLITPPLPSQGAAKIRLAGGGLITLTVAAFCFFCVALHAGPAPVASDESAWAITGMDGIIESVATHPVTLESFFGDVHNRCIWYRDTSGGTAVLRKFSAESDGLLGVFALKFSADGNTLWASCSAVPEMKGYNRADKGRAFLAAYDLKSRQLRRTFPLPVPGDDRMHVLGDFILADDGGILATDSTAPVIWRLSPRGDQLEKWIENPAFKSLQGLAYSPDARSLLVADYGKGLWRIELATRSATLLAPPAGANLRGIDGLYAVPGGLLAVQNGVNPQRILRIGCDPAGNPSRVEVLLAGHPAMPDCSLGQVINGHFQFIGNSGWELYANPAATPAARIVKILSTPLE